MPKTSDRFDLEMMGKIRWERTMRIMKSKPDMTIRPQGLTAMSRPGIVNALTFVVVVPLPPDPSAPIAVARESWWSEVAEDKVECEVVVVAVNVVE